MFMLRMAFKISGLPGRTLCRCAGLALIATLLAGLTGCAWLDAKVRELVYRPTLERQANFSGLRPGDLSFATRVPGITAGTQDSLQM